MVWSQKVKLHFSVLSKKSLDRWEYAGLNGSLYGAEMGVYTEEGIRKLEVIQNEMASWIVGLQAARGTATEALRGELGWHSTIIRKIIYERN